MGRPKISAGFWAPALWPPSAFRHTDDLRAAMEAGRADLAVGPVPEDWAGPVHEIGAEEFIIAGAQDPG